MSEVDDFLKALGLWGAAHDTYALALQKVGKVLDSAGRRLHTEWSGALQALKPLSLRPDLSGGADPLSSAAALATAPESHSYELVTAAVLILDPNVHAASSVGLSQTFSDDRRLLVREADAARDAMAAAKRAALALAAPAGA